MAKEGTEKTCLLDMPVLLVLDGVAVIVDDVAWLVIAALEGETGMISDPVPLANVALPVPQCWKTKEAPLIEIFCV